MSEQRNVTITVSAKNLTDTEFKKVSRSLQTIARNSEETTQRAGRMETAFKNFGFRSITPLEAVKKASIATLGAVTALGGGIALLARRGTELSGVESSFQRLAGAAGESSEEIVRQTRMASDGLVTNLEAMQAANKGLLLGLPITARSMGELTETAITLGRAMGQSASRSLDDLITGLGRASPLILDNLGITVKAGEAYQRYAERIGVSSSELTEAQKKTAFYEAALVAARARVQEIGDQQLTLGERFRQSTTTVTNFIDKLSIGIARSPVFNAAMTSINEALQRTFGDESDQRVNQLTRSLETGAFVLVNFAKVGLTGADILHRVWSGLELVFNGVAAALSTAGASMMSMVASVLEAAASVPMLRDQYLEAAEAARQSADQAQAVAQSFRDQTAEAWAGVTGNDAYTESLAAGRVSLDQLSESMRTASGTQQQLNTSTAANTAANQQNAVSLEGINLGLQNVTMSSVGWQGGLDQTTEKTRMWAEVTQQAMWDNASSAEGFGEAVAGVGDLVHSKNQQMLASFRFFGANTKKELQKLAEVAEQNFNRMNESGQATAEDLDAAWQAVLEARAKTSTDTSEHMLSADQALLTGAMQVTRAFGERSKAAAIAAAVIQGLLAVQRALGSAPWPFSLALAAGAAAATAANLAKMRRAPAYEVGTRRLDFEQFGRETPALLHGAEAVIPQGSGHLLGREIAAELRRSGSLRSDDTMMMDRLEALIASIEELPTSIERGMRDGILLAQ